MWTDQIVIDHSHHKVDIPFVRLKRHAEYINIDNYITNINIFQCSMLTLFGLATDKYICER